VSAERDPTKLCVACSFGLLLLSHVRGVLPFKPQNCIETYSCSINTVHCHYHWSPPTTPLELISASSTGKYRTMIVVWLIRLKNFIMTSTTSTAGSHKVDDWRDFEKDLAPKNDLAKSLFDRSSRRESPGESIDQGEVAPPLSTAKGTSMSSQIQRSTMPPSTLRHAGTTNSKRPPHTTGNVS
jgi:hypothetical protein